MSDADRKRITAMVQAETAESIQEIEPHGNGTVLVHTGAPRGGGDGRGQLFTLRRSFGAWKIISRGTWITCG
jgi:hypothetical protein